MRRCDLSKGKLRESYVRGAWDALMDNGADAKLIATVFRALGIGDEDVITLTKVLRAEETKDAGSDVVRTQYISSLFSGMIYECSSDVPQHPTFRVRLLSEEPDVEGKVRVARITDNMITWVHPGNLKEVGK